MGLTGSEYLAMDGVALARAVSSGDVSPTEALHAALARADETVGLNAIVRRYDDLARGLARTVVPGASPLAGVPTVLKDIGATMSGMAMRSGSRFVPEFPGGFDSGMVAFLKQAGMVPFGVTNAPEFGLACVTEPVLYGAAGNPRAPGRTTGGSSGGAAAAVAAGVVPVAHATDGGGSIRIPASCCGLVGLKTSRGRISVAPDGEWASGTSVTGFVTRTVRDTAAVLDAVSGYRVGDPYVTLDEGRGFLETIGRDPARRLRIGFDVGPIEGVAHHPEVVRVVAAAARLCERLGHDVEETRPAMIGRETLDSGRHRAFHMMYSVALAASIDSWSAHLGKTPTPDDVEAVTWAYYQEGKSHRAADHLRALWHLDTTARVFAAFFEEVDVWLTPTLAQPPLELGAFDANAFGSSMHDPLLHSFNPLCPYYNATGLPAITLPLGSTADGLPIGVMFGARLGAEAMLLQLASQIERASPWPTVPDAWRPGVPA